MIPLNCYTPMAVTCSISSVVVVPLNNKTLYGGILDVSNLSFHAFFLRCDLFIGGDITHYIKSGRIIGVTTVGR
ncbi:hypothetical protein HNY73_022838 [Argiope bruennichi]|uniref:Uncharacterized protein n=1 Tax=Argiope bruennichi TaxID=94029 RepID=A0A8T0E267_ARGBR|nr:hypothetical protein HNY73_022838 [Argiope bruennichi]